MKLSNQIEEALETLWVHTHEMHEDHMRADDITPGDPATLEEMAKNNLIVLEGGNVTLTPKGVKEGRAVIRRHRLAELLLTEVLDVKGEDLIHDTACAFEHLLRKGIDEKICILLGHPKVCPHGKAIPPGKCCEKRLEELDQSVVPLSSLKPEQIGKITYLRTKESKELQKLMAMGMLPGTSIRLIRSFPSYVFRMGYTQFAVDRQIAHEIFVRLIN
ncbi:MAG: metal-dependent transcriptional regulator [Deltaproteobacteria bacterium]|nr:metal-dependent transcriptional regulator [Deltaproteobacteria bacterium]